MSEFAVPSTDKLTCFDTVCVDSNFVAAMATVILALALVWILAALTQP